MSTSRITFTAVDGGLLACMDWEAPLAQLLAEVEQRILKSPAFFADAKVFLEVDTRPVLQHEMQRLGVVLSRHGLTLQGVVMAAGRAEGIARTGPARRPPGVIEPVMHGKGAGVVEGRIVRSGDKVASDGHLVIMGDVNPGAEVIAAKNIIVWGSLKGAAHAGVPNHEDAVIAALDLSPIQVRIAGYIARSPDARPLTAAVPELARIDRNEVVVEPWQPG